MGGVEEGEVEASQPTWDDGPQLITNLHTLVREAFFFSLFLTENLDMEKFHILLQGRGSGGYIKKANKLAVTAFWQKSICQQKSVNHVTVVTKLKM